MRSLFACDEEEDWGWVLHILKLTGEEHFLILTSGITRRFGGG